MPFQGGIDSTNLVMITNGMNQTIIKNPSWWKRRTGLERGLTVIAVSGFLLCITLTLALGILATKMTCSTTSRTGQSIHFYSDI